MFDRFLSILINFSEIEHTLQVCWFFLITSGQFSLCFFIKFFFFKVLHFIFFLIFTLYLFIYLFLAVLGLLFCAWAFSSCSSGGHSSSRCAGLSLSRPLLLRSTGSRRAGSAIVAHGPNCSVACGIFPDQGSNPCSLHWQADFQPLRHQGSPIKFYWLE